MNAQTAADQPLAGIKIIELHAIGPVPFAGQLLRSLGADVKRVSPPSDPGLGMPTNPRFDLSNYGKTPVAIDLKNSEGLAQARALIDGADVMLEGFRPGVIERLGLGPDVLLKSNPRLVIARLSGWGTKGPYAERAGHDINYLALSGLLHAIGTKDTPVPPLNVVGDYGGGAMHLAVGVLSALVKRSVDGRGSVVTSSILAGSVGLSHIFYGMLAAGRWTTDREANVLDGGAPYYRVYATSDGRHMSVGAIEPKFYAELVKMTGLEGQIDLSKQNDRSTWPDTVAKFSAAFAKRPLAEWGQHAERFDACAAPVLNFIEAASHPHNQANSLYGLDPFPHPDRILDITR
jgi:alpha-methylacyl-CoA racemase